MAFEAPPFLAPPFFAAFFGLLFLAPFPAAFFAPALFRAGLAFFAGLAVFLAPAFLAVAFRRLYARSKTCAVGEACAVPSVRHRQRVIFWVVVPAALALMSFPLYAPLFY